MNSSISVACTRTIKDLCSQYDNVVKFSTPIEASSIIGLILHAGRCSNASLITSNSKFCSWEGKENGDLNCYLPKERCFCDQQCCRSDDCCPDVKIFCSSSELTSM